MCGGPEVKYAFIRDYRDRFEVQLMCEVLEVSRSGFYSWLTRDSSEQEKRKMKIKKEIEEIFMGSDKTYGSPRVYEVLIGLGYKISEDTVSRYMKELGLSAKVKKFKVVTTDSKHSMPIASNKLEQNFTATKPNEIWLSDITYVRTQDGWLYLVSILDLYTRKIIGWNLSSSLSGDKTLLALEMALKQQKPGSGVIFHSDRGIQYAAEKFRHRLEELGFIQSMSRKGNCYDNAPMESFFHTLKVEYVYRHQFEKKSRPEASRSIFWWIEAFYNRKRIHSSIGYKTPVAMEEAYVLAQAA